MSAVDTAAQSTAIGADPAVTHGDARRTHGPVRLVAHRGAPRIRRENTLPAVAVAEALGATAIEVDVRRTADGVAVLLHDETLGRLWGDPRRVDATPWCDVARLGNGLDRIPTLDAVLDRLDGTDTTLVVDLTNESDAVAAALVVRSTGTADRVQFCGAPEAMAAVRGVLPDADVWLAWTSLEPPRAEDLVALRPSTLNLDAAFLTPAIIAAAKGLGLTVSVWTVDEPEVAVWAASLGADSITTNDVPTIRAALERAERDGWPAPPEHSEAEVAARAQTVAHRIAHEIIAFTREHPVESIATKANPADLVTDVDRQVEQSVRGRIRQEFPHHGFSGEEFGTAPGDKHHWWLDPVDGTTNLANGIPWSSMSLCLTRNGRPLVGVVADPWRGEVLEARRGRGAWIRERALRLQTVDNRMLAGGAVGTELDGHLPWRGFDRFLAELGARSCTLRVMGSGTLTLAQVAAGRGVGACVSSFNPIDHGAAVLIVQEAGGVVFSHAGPVAGFPPVGEPVLVAHPSVADELVALWRDCLGEPPE